MVDIDINSTKTGSYRQRLYRIVSNAGFKVIEMTVASEGKSRDVCVGIKIRRESGMYSQAERWNGNAVFFRFFDIATAGSGAFDGALPKHAGDAVTPIESVFVRGRERVGDVEFQVMERAFCIDFAAITPTAECEHVSAAEISVAAAMNVNVIECQAFIAQNELRRGIVTEAEIVLQTDIAAVVIDFVGMNFRLEMRREVARLYRYRRLGRFCEGE